MKLLVQEFLETHSLTQLREERGVKHRWSTKRPGVLTLNYDQLEVTDTDPLSQECRGLVLRSAHGESVIDDCVAGPPALARLDAMVGGLIDTPLGPTEILALPFTRFFNHGTGPCAEVALDRARFYEKLDGTFCIVHHDRGEWHVGTRGVPDADVPIEGGTETFRGLFERALRECGESLGLATTLGEGLDPNHTYMFELTAPENQIVVRYEERSVSLLGIRDRRSGAELPPETMADRYLICPYHPVDETVLASWVHERDPMKHEGLVVCDYAFRRAKVKSAAYLAIARATDGVGRSDRRMLDVVLRGDEEKIRPALAPYLVEKLDRTKAAFAAFCERTDADYERLHHPDRKTFALAIQAEKAWMPALMARWSGKVPDTRAFIQSAKREGTWPDPFLDTVLAGMGLNDATEERTAA